MKQQHHFVLVHGVCHGAWCWFHVKHRLESAGHRVTPLNLAGAGTSTKSIYDVHSFREYNEPLLEFMASLEPSEKVILVGHSLGGMSLALIADKFPEKISAAVFLTALMPDTTHQPSLVLEQFRSSIPEQEWLDTQFKTFGKTEKLLTSFLLGPEFLAARVYPLSPKEDLELAKIMMRPGSLFIEDLATADKFTGEGYGSIVRVYVVCKQDLVIPEEFQRRMMKNGGAQHVMEIDGAGHMPMFSEPQKLCDCLLEVAAKYT
ncbi:salicylic acid-binding protein 2 [Eucalyptus grandis]|uniref:AB hydrolase-1 domain-containing protein n=2 Tax=Eucalyptus grandis TaxID=71139 RepID=A0A059AMG5_EUCGR|nr:salicylic acid-binding protein 2 [Eucalyptus grandis]KAK3412219.1 hypothetical protein EUGRSUZ_I01008 [Eucalyptus grandis]